MQSAEDGIETVSFPTGTIAPVSPSSSEDRSFSLSKSLHFLVEFSIDKKYLLGSRIAHCTTEICLMGELNEDFSFDTKARRRRGQPGFSSGNSLNNNEIELDVASNFCAGNIANEFSPSSSSEGSFSDLAQELSGATESSEQMEHFP